MDTKAVCAIFFGTCVFCILHYKSCVTGEYLALCA